jgi:pimeloyl-ACP methyl ester carboxylesterase
VAKKTSGTFKSYEGEKQYFDCYDALLGKWPVSAKENRVETTYGETSILVCGKKSAPPVVLLHPLNTGSVVWAFGIETLAANHYVYAVDTIGDAGKFRMAG